LTIAHLQQQNTLHITSFVPMPFSAIRVLVAIMVLLLAAAQAELRTNGVVASAPSSAPDTACCPKACKSAICVPPWVSICSGCGPKATEQEEVAAATASPTKASKDDTKCCAPTCGIKVCVKPWVTVCLECHAKADEKVEVFRPDAAEEEEVATAPYKHCCDPKCRSQICVPPFVAICNGCPNQDGGQVLVQ
jgi:hypothetical protein